MSTEKKITIESAYRIMGDSMIGPAELSGLKEVSFLSDEMNIQIPFSEKETVTRRKDYLLVLGISRFSDGSPVTIRNIKNRFGQNPEEREPCFYNQDWYNQEAFLDVPMRNEWFFIRQNVYEESRAVQPADLMKRYSFPSAIQCTYAFFTAWLSKGIRLWYHDFVWCNDTDHNGDRIYVGKYHDVDGINKNGFSIHRHLALRQCYACID